MYLNQYRHLLLLMVGCCLVICTSCRSASQGATTGNNASAGPALVHYSSPTSIPSPSPSTQIPQTSCPASGTARAAITPPMTSGHTSTLVYYDNAVDPPGNPVSSVLKRYNPVTGQSSAIIRLEYTNIDDAQISPDGQWMLFIFHKSPNNGYAIGLVRVDGGYLQTLYCSAGGPVGDLQWSPNQKFLMFSEAASPSPPIYWLLEMVNGNIQVEFITPSKFYGIGTWLNDTRIYLYEESQVGNYPIYILDTRKGPDQKLENLQLAAKTLNYTALTPDKTQWISWFNAGDPKSPDGPSTISVQPTIGGKTHLIYSSQTPAVEHVIAISNTVLLVDIENYRGDTSQNGLWSMNIDGTGMKRLMVTHYVQQGLQEIIMLSYDWQIPWSNVSRDGSMYAAQKLGDGDRVLLIVGSMSGKTLTSTTIASDGTSSGLPLQVAGWTML